MNPSEHRKQSSLFSFLSCYFFPAIVTNSESDDPGRLRVVNESTTLLENGNDRRFRFSDANSFDEIPPFINERRNALQDELRGIKGKTSYHLANAHAPTFVCELEILFLRAEDWNEAKASIRMLNFFEAKHSLFGSHALGRQLQITDLDCEALECLRSGAFQILPSRDNQTRRVLCFFPCKPDSQATSLVCLTSLHQWFDSWGFVKLILLSCVPITQVKAWWFFVMRILEIGNPKFQRSDFVGVVFYESSLRLMQLDHDLYWHALCSLRQLPLKVSEWHFCHDGFLVDAALPILTYCYAQKEQMDSFHLHKGT